MKNLLVAACIGLCIGLTTIGCQATKTQRPACECVKCDCCDGCPGKCGSCECSCKDGCKCCPACKGK